MISVNKKEATLARNGKLLLERLPATVEIVSAQVPQSRLELPKTAVRALIEALGFISEGHNVVVQPLKDELSTQKAAEVLKVSRPFLIKLLESGEIPFHKVGKHRRVAVTDLQEYKNRIDTKRLKVLDQLAGQAQELEMGY